MKLKSIQFTEDEGKPEQWRLEDCTLSDMNLIVGKNVTGKTRTLNAIATLCRYEISTAFCGFSSDRGRTLAG